MNLQEYKQCVNELDNDKIAKLAAIIASHTDIIILGNGGSNAISCHIAQDYTKKLHKRAISFGDTSRMSCYANDYGWDNAYAKFVEDFVLPGSLVILISSSGNSMNILASAAYCINNGIPFISLSGFGEDNALHTICGEKALLDFYIKSNDYGIVECLHELILHSVI